MLYETFDPARDLLKINQQLKTVQSLFLGT